MPRKVTVPPRRGDVEIHAAVDRVARQERAAHLPLKMEPDRSAVVAEIAGVDGAERAGDVGRAVG